MNQNNNKLLNRVSFNIVGEKNYDIKELLIIVFKERRNHSQEFIIQFIYEYYEYKVLY